MTVEENVLTGGFGSIVNNAMQATGRCGIPVYNMGIPDEFVAHGNQSYLRSFYGLDTAGIADKVRKIMDITKTDAVHR